MKTDEFDPRHLRSVPTGNCMQIVWPDQDIDDDSASEEYPACAWERRFDVCEMDAILHMLSHLTKGLPGFVQRWLLRRASRLPRLHGRFAPYYGTLGFHAEEGEVIGMSERWIVHENGVREKLW